VGDTARGDVLVGYRLKAGTGGVDVRVGLRPWRGDRQVAQEDAVVLFIESIEVDGTYWSTTRAKLSLEGFASVEVTLKNPPPSDAGSFEEFRSRYGPDDYLMGTTDTVLYLPVRSIEMIDLGREKP
jgi:hypothetical protein